MAFLAQSRNATGSGLSGFNRPHQASFSLSFAFRPELSSQLLLQHHEWLPVGMPQAVMIMHSPSESISEPPIKCPFLVSCLDHDRRNSNPHTALNLKESMGLKDNRP